MASDEFKGNMDSEEFKTSTRNMARFIQMESFKNKTNAPKTRGEEGDRNLWVPVAGSSSKLCYMEEIPRQTVKTSLFGKIFGSPKNETKVPTTPNRKQSPNHSENFPDGRGTTDAKGEETWTRTGALSFEGENVITEKPTSQPANRPHVQPTNQEVGEVRCWFLPL
jgi:hypothetical protein